MNKFQFAVTFCTLAGMTHASNLNLQVFSNAHTTSAIFNGFSRDRSTGTYYKASHYVGSTLNSYNNLADFQNDTGSTTTGLDDLRLGTYSVVRNGKFFARSGNNVNGTQISRFDAATGTTELTANYASYDGNNGTATFDWGGYSGFNLYDDPSGLFMIGRDLAGDQRLNKLDANLNITNSYIIGDFSGDPAIGYAFNVKGQLFVGMDFFDTNFGKRVDMATGLVSNVNFTFTGITGFPYISHVWYDDLADRLYVTSAGTFNFPDDRTYYLDDAASALGVVPEPGSLTVALLAITALKCRRKKA